MRLNPDECRPWRYQGKVWLSSPEDRAAMFALKGQNEAQAKLFSELVAAERVQPWVHRFEKAGLGLYPFRCVGMETKAYVACHGAPVQPGGTCDYCGNAILYVFHIVSKDGKHFNVGSDCVCRTGDEGLKRDVDRQPAWKAAKREQARAAKAKRDAAILANLRALLADKDVLAALAAMPHPLGFVDRDSGQPLTALDWAQWNMSHCGAAGRSSLFKAIQAKVQEYRASQP